MVTIIDLHSIWFMKMILMPYHGLNIVVVFKLCTKASTSWVGIYSNEMSMWDVSMNQW